MEDKENTPMTIPEFIESCYSGLKAKFDLSTDEEKDAIIERLNKVQSGLGTALKILFSGEFDRPGLPVVATADLKLSRNEIVALFNSFGKLSTSILELERFRQMMRKRR